MIKFIKNIIRVRIENSKLRIKNSQGGFSTLVSIIIVGAVALSISVSLLSSTVDVSSKIKSNQDLFYARTLADSCAEQGLEKLRVNSSYAGLETLTYTYGSCQILAPGGTGNTNRTIQTIGTSGSSTRKVTVSISVVSPQMNITAWDEVQ